MMEPLKPIGSRATNELCYGGWAMIRRQLAECQLILTADTLEMREAARIRFESWKRAITAKWN